jgi:transcription elongation factor Elf1
MSYEEYVNRLENTFVFNCYKCDNEICIRDQFITPGAYRCNNCGEIYEFRTILELLSFHNLWDILYRNYYK